MIAATTFNLIFISIVASLPCPAVQGDDPVARINERILTMTESEDQEKTVDALHYSLILVKRFALKDCVLSVDHTAMTRQLLDLLKYESVI